MRRAVALSSAPAAAANAIRGSPAPARLLQVTRPDELWHLDMTSVWVAERGWCYLNDAVRAGRTSLTVVARTLTARMCG